MSVQLVEDRVRGGDEPETTYGCVYKKTAVDGGQRSYTLRIYRILMTCPAPMLAPIWINLVNPYKGPMRKILLFFDEESEVQDHTASQR